MFTVKKWPDGFYQVLFNKEPVELFRCRDNAHYLASELNATLKRVQKMIPGMPAAKRKPLIKQFEDGIRESKRGRC